MGLHEDEVLGLLVTPVGYDGIDFHDFIVDSDGKLLIHVDTAESNCGLALESTLQSLYDLVQNIYANVPSKVIGQLGVLRGRTTLTASSGTVDVDYTIPGTNEKYVLTAIGALNFSGGNTSIMFAMVSGGTTYYFTSYLNTIVNQIVGYSGRLVCESGDIVRAHFVGGGAGNVLGLYVLGYRCE